MYLNDGGYSEVQYDVHLLRKTARAIADKLPGIMRETGADTIVVTGKSGISLAFATLMLIEFPLVVVRNVVRAHGAKIEGKGGTCVHSYLVLDDFVSSGETVRTVIASITEQAVLRESTAPVCVGCVMYKRVSGASVGVPMYYIPEV